MNASDEGDDISPDGASVTFEPGDEDFPPSVAVVEAIAAAEDVSTSEVDFSLYDEVDPDALDAIFAANTEESVKAVTATFVVDEYVVQVEGDGTITVSPRDGGE